VNVLVDTSVWSISLRRSHDNLSREELVLKQELQSLIEERRIQIIGPVRQELLTGFRQRDQFERLRERLRFYRDPELTSEDYEEAARIHNECRSAGIAGSGVDFLICAVALRHNWEVFTLDKDFERYARRLPLVLFAPRRSKPQ
jgi:predicted nucleic acid-binding protein